MDSQTSADAKIGGNATGALSWAFIKVFSENPPGSLTYNELLHKIRQILAGKFSQIPQMSSGTKMNMDTKFIM